MVKKIIYVIVSIALGMIVYLVSISLESQNKQVELLKEAIDKTEYDDFLAYSTPFYKYDSEYFTDDYQIVIYKMIGQEDESIFFSYILFINGLNEELFKTAITIDDEDDKTDLLIYKDEEQIYSHQDEMVLKDQYIAITYGVEVYNGYYYTYDPAEIGEFTVSLLNYNGEEFERFVINHQETLDVSTTLDSDDVINYAEAKDYEKGNSSQERINLFKGKINRNMIIYGIIIIGLFFLFFRKSIFKRKKKNLDVMHIE